MSDPNQSELGDRTGRKPSSFFRKHFANTWSEKRPKKEDGEDEEEIHHRAGLHLLHSSPDPLIDLIFIHGLKGHPVKTWRKSGEPRSFWPQYWLPADPEFYHVNIHTFGYEVDWADSKSSTILNINDFGQALLEEMRNSPHLRNNERGPIVLLGHSLGGLVIKRVRRPAFILAKDVSGLGERIRTIFFLGTPHRGSDYASTLNRVLALLLSSRDYLKDLATGSTSIRLINDEFGQRAPDLPIFSFFETLKMSVGVTSDIIVPRDSAVLGPGFTNERVQYLDANHRDMVKFAHPSDDNYLKLKKALSGAVSDLIKEVTILKQEETKKQIRILQSWLSVSNPQDELHQHQKAEGTCQWIDERFYFQPWRDLASDFHHPDGDEPSRHKPAIIWVHANPGTGKTVLATHVIAELRELKFECSYYYFHIGGNESCSLGVFLRSIALQMALNNTTVRQKLVQLCQDGLTLNLDDGRSIWSKVFLKGIFQARLLVPQFWVVDALDECNKYQELFTMLKGEYPSFPLRIFITSRNVPDIQHLSRRLEAWTSLTTIEIPVNDSMRDIECYIQSRVENLPFKTLRERAELVKAIIDRSNTCFLWVRLIMDKLETVYSSDSIMGVLRELPEGMVPYYERTIHEMAENKMEKHIAKAIILWTVASSRKLTTSELSDALKLDINAVLPSARAAIEGLCGQLVTIDKKSDTVDVVHSTAREFLLTEDAGEFTVSMTAAHERIALTCLKVLASPEMQPPRSRRAPQSEGESSPFLRYAITQFSGHLYCASSQADSLLAVLDRFFRAMVLSWIERVAREGDLHCFIRTSRDLKAYVDRCAKHRSPLNKQLKNIGDWSTDLSRLVTKFGEALLKDPTSIRCIIPPLCPISSPLYQQFGRRPDGLDIVGFKPETWDDCIASVGFGEGNPTAVSCGENLIAVSMTSGGIKLFRQQTCQKLRVLGNKWPVDLLHFTDKHIAVCTIRSLLVQDLEGNKLWEKRIRSRFIHLVSSGDSIYTMNQNGRLVVYNALNGQVDRDEGFEYRNHDVDTDHNQSTHGTPWVAPVSPDVETLAMAFRGGTVCLWDLPSSEFIGWARDDDDLLPAKMMFNPNPNVKLLLIIYTNHRISLFNTWSGSMLETWNPEVETGILSAACSNDGRTFVTTNTQGSLQIWDFESLALLYHIETPFSPQRILNFSSCGTSIVDVSASCMRIWSPAALVRRNVEEDGSIGEDAVQIHPTLGQSGPMSSTRITALCTHPSSPIVFTATFEGKVFAFDAKAGKQLAELYAHPSMECVNNLAVGRNGYIASSDSNAVMQVWKLDLGQVTNTKTPTLLLQLRMKSPVKQLCFSDSGNYLLVSTGVSDHVYSMENGELVGSWQFEPQEREIWQWIQVSDHPNQEPQLGLICDRSFERFSAPEFPKAIEGSGMVLNYKLKEGDEEKEVESFACDTVAGALILHVQHHSGFSSSSTTFLFNLGNKDQRTGTQPSLSPTYRFPNEFWKNFLGVSKKTRNFMFVDGGSWLSSLDPRHLARGKSYTRHFFVPNEYISTRYEEEKVQPVMTADDDVVFCLYGELVIMKNGLKFWDEKELDLAKHTVGVKTMATIT